MVRMQGSTTIARPVEDVFDFVADERNEPRYNPQMVRVDKITSGPIGPGTRWAATVRSRGRPVDMEIEVTDFTRPHRLGSATHLSTAEIRGALTFEPAAAGTRMTWTWDFRPRGLLRLMGPVIGRVGRRQEEAIWAGLKRHLEATPPTGV